MNDQHTTSAATVSLQRQADRDAAQARRTAERERDAHYKGKRAALAAATREDERHAYRQMTPDQQRRVNALIASRRKTTVLARQRPNANPGRDDDDTAEGRPRPRLASPVSRSLTATQVAQVAQQRAGLVLDPGARAVLAALLGAVGTGHNRHPRRRPQPAVITCP
jgi:hypothetical protein